VSVAADFVPKSGAIARTMSLAVRYETTSGIGGQIGVGRLRNDTKYFVGLTYRLGRKR
jgi:hypothetical protein